MMQPGLKAGVTGVHIAGSPRVGAAVIKELARQGDIRVVALADYPQTCALGWRDLVHSAFLVPQAFVGGEALRDRILAVHAGVHLDVVLPCDDEDVAGVANMAEELENEGIAVLVPPPETVRMTTKEHLSATLRGAGIPVARQDVLQEDADLSRSALAPPMVVKGRLMHAHLARTSAEAHAFVSQLADLWGFPVILQEALEGAEFSVAGVATRDSRLVGVCAIRKLGISDQGKTWLATTILPGEFGDLLEALVSRLRWVGPIEVEFIARTDGCKPVVIEINPRLPAWISVARHAGVDLVRLTVDLALGAQPAGRVIAAPGKCFARSYRTGSFPMRNMAKFYSHGELRFDQDVPA